MSAYNNTNFDTSYYLYLAFLTKFLKEDSILLICSFSFL